MTEEPEPTPYGVVPVARELAELRLRAEEVDRSHDHPTLLALADRLRAEDSQMWPHLWAPQCAMAARRLGDDRVWPLLDEAIAKGFTQPELFDGELDAAFDGDPAWANAVERMEHCPPPDLELVEWPDPAPQPTVRLDRLAPARERELLGRIPEDVRRAGAWPTAVAALVWARRSWEHANDHVEVADAIDVLDRVAEGRRFACVEYSIVLSQALNALGLPARRVGLLQRPHHAGVGRGHVVSEAWIDDLGRWVLLDGQNGAYWVGGDGQPLGVADLVALYRDRGTARMECLAEAVEPSVQAFWFTYFATVQPTGLGIPDGAFAPSFQGVSVPRVAHLTRRLDNAYPDLDVVTVGTTGDLDAPLLTLATPHPFATGFRISGDGWVEDVEDSWPIRRDTAGEHTAAVALRTTYGVGRSHSLRWHVRG